MKMSTSIPSNVCLNPLCDTLSTTSLKTLLSVISTCLGPHGKLKLLQNASGGCCSITSSSQRLFNQLSIKNTFSKVIASAAKSQLRAFNDNGLLCSLWALNLITISVDYPLPLFGALYNCMGKMYIECLNSQSNACTFDVDFSNLSHLKSIVHTVLSSKPGCGLTTWDRSHLCNLLLEAFLNIVPSRLLEDCNIRLLFSGGSGAKNSCLYDGLLLKVSENAFANVNTQGPFKTVLFTVSLPVDIPVKLVEGASSREFLEVILRSAENVMAKIIEEGVQIVFCQKVIHPRLKKQLQNAKVLVLDRLGSDTAKYVQYITGGSSNSSLISEVKYGIISRIQEQKVGRDHFLLFCNNNIVLFSLVLCNYCEEAGLELMVVCRQAIDALFRVLKSSHVCFGAGCTEIHTAHLLARKVKENVHAIREETGCSLGEVHSALHSFVRSVADVCVALHQDSRLNFMTDVTSGHLWKLHDEQLPEGRCACGHLTATDIRERSSWRQLSDLANSTSFGDGSVVSDCIPQSFVALDELSCKVASSGLGIETAVLLLQTTLLVNNASQNN